MPAAYRGACRQTPGFENPEGMAMFDVFCTECSRRQLVSPGQVAGIHNDESGIHVIFRCSRGHVGVWDTGRAASDAAAAVGVAA